MAVSVNALLPNTPPTTAIQDPAARTWANSVANILSASQSSAYAVQQLSKAAEALSGGGAVPPSIAQWLFSSDLYWKLTQAIEKVDVAAKQAIIAEALERANAIAQEQADRTDAIFAESQARAAEFVAEREARSLAIEGEAQARATAILAEQQARVDAINAEVSARTNAIADERTARIAAIQLEHDDRVQALAAEALARGTAISNEAAVRQGADDALATQITTVSAVANGSLAAIQAEVIARVDGDAALSQQVTTLTSAVNGNSAAISSEATARADADAALAQQVSTLSADTDSNFVAVQSTLTALADADGALAERVDALVASTDSIRAATAAMVVQEVRARTDSDSAFAQQITTLSAAVDDNAANIQTESTTRASQYDALAEQITLVSAGVGEQFDFKQIWYFDDGVDGWTGNGAPTVSAGWLRPANHATDPYVDSPAALAVTATQHNQVRLRIRKYGTPTWAGKLWWKRTTDSTWDAARSIVLDEPTYDGTGIGLVSVSASWADTIDQVRLALSTAQDATNYFTIDWFAVGRPSPGASTAALLNEATARATADTALTNQFNSLSSTVTGNYGTLNAAITTEATTRANADSALSSQINSVSATASGKNKVFVQSATPAATQTNDLWIHTGEGNKTYRWNGTAWVAVDDARIAQTAAAVVTETNARVDGDEALAQQISTLSTTVVDNDSVVRGLISSESTTRASADTALAGQISALSSTVATNDTAVRSLITNEATARADADGALSSQINTLTSMVSANDTTVKGLISSEATTRADADTALSGQITAITATVTGNDAAVRGLITTESATRASADEALSRAADFVSATAESIRAATAAMAVSETVARANQDEAFVSRFDAIEAEVDANSALITNEQTVRAAADSALASSVWTLQARVESVESGTTSLAIQVLDRYTKSETDAAVSGSFSALTANYQTADASTLSSANSYADGRFSTAQAAITAEATARANADGALTTQINTVSSVANGRNRTFRQSTAPTGATNGDLWYDTANNNSMKRWDGSSWVATDNAKIASNEAAIVTEATTRANNDASIVSAVNTMWAITGATNALTQSGNSIVTNWTTAQAEKWSQLEAEVFTAGGKTIRAALSEEAQVRANADGSLGAQWTLKTDINGYISGFGFASTANNATPTSEFIIRADKFAVVMPGYGEHVPFAIGPSGAEFTGLTSWSNVTGAGKPENGATVGADWFNNVTNRPDPTSFLETFESGSVTQWTNHSGAGELSVVSVADSLTGGKVLRIGNNSGNDQAWLIHKQNIPFDPSALYRIKFRVRRTAGTGVVYLGLAGVAADGVTLVNLVGANDPSNQHYVAAVGQGPGSTWTEYVGYVKGTAATGQTGTNPSITAPLKLHQSVKYIRPLILANHQSAAGTTEVDYCSIELMTDAMSWDAVSGTGKDNLVATASTALTNANNARTEADKANASLADIAADSKLTPAEKKSVRKEWDAVYAERAGIRAQATSFRITTELTNYDNAFQALGTYLNAGTAYTIGATPPSWITDVNLAVTTNIVGTTFRTNWATLYQRRQELLNKISAEAAKMADWSSVTGSGKPLDNSGRVIDGERTTNPAPQDFPPGETFYFKQSSSVGVTGAGTYGVLRTVRPYGTGVDLSGGGVFQWFEAEQLVWARKSTSATAWSSWQRVPNETITASNVTTYIANAAIGNAQIGGNLWSTNWNYAGGTGWLLDRSGNFYGNNIYARGNIEASSLKANTAMVNRANIVNAAVDTLQIAGNAVTIPVHSRPPLVYVTAGGWTSLTTAWINAEGSTVSIFASASVSTTTLVSAQNVSIRVLSPSGLQIGRNVISLRDGLYSPAILITSSTEAGTYTLQIYKSGPSSTLSVEDISLFLIGTKR